ncbi:MAG: hypothetical protein MIO92_16630 [Methanosarcinaceae archaeon]|nr:hypothetical protein [Methanosarcinaceae archaeon]
MTTENRRIMKYVGLEKRLEQREPVLPVRPDIDLELSHMKKKKICVLSR